MTRSLLKRQIRAAFVRHEHSLAYGLWVVRLRAPFARDQFPSAASAALLQSVSTEIEALLQRALRPANAA